MSTHKTETKALEVQKRKWTMSATISMCAETDVAKEKDCL